MQPLPASRNRDLLRRKVALPPSPPPSDDAQECEAAPSGGGCSEAPVPSYIGLAADPQVHFYVDVDVFINVDLSIYLSNYMNMVICTGICVRIYCPVGV